MKAMSPNVAFNFGFVLAAISSLCIIGAIFFPCLRAIVSGLGSAIAVPGIFGAALIAYSGSVAKVEFDERQIGKQKQENTRSQLNLIASACDYLVFASKQNDEIFSAILDNQNSHVFSLIGREVQISVPIEFIEAIKNVSVLPASVNDQVIACRSLLIDLIHKRESYDDFVKMVNEDPDLTARDIIGEARTVAVLERYRGLFKLASTLLETCKREAKNP